MEGAVKHFSCLWVASLVCAVSAAGCGLVLDTQARELREDSGPGEDSGQQDGDVTECVIDDQCQNGNVCDGRETCVGGSCVGTDAILNCADAFDCTDDSCDPQLGCVFTPVQDRCDGGGVCVVGVGCSAAHPCEGPADCGVQHVCDGLECVDGFCQRGTPLSCPDNGCLVGGCFAGTCVYAPDSSRCNPNDTGCARSRCESNGECSAPEPDHSLCDDHIPCTDDRCEMQGGTGPLTCVFTPNHEFCDDGVDCTTNFCAPLDPTAAASDDGCAIRLNDVVCAEQGGFDGCVTPLCLPTGCSDGVAVIGCLDGGVCDVMTGECDDSVSCGTPCIAAGSPCSPTRCNLDLQTCVPGDVNADPCASSVPCTVGFCDISGSTPRCNVRPDPMCALPIDVPVTPAP